jgi:hypothetical protein
MLLVYLSTVIVLTLPWLYGEINGIKMNEAYKDPRKAILVMREHQGWGIESPQHPEPLVSAAQSVFYRGICIAST